MSQGRSALDVLREQEALLRDLLARGAENADARERSAAGIAAIAAHSAELRALTGADRDEARRLATSILELHACVRAETGRQLARTAAAIERTRAASTMLGPARGSTTGGSCDVEG